jgi:2-polyprenyl-3-methyl-5-hydroxy-6-metoxy-1,4-benzoquinol methylase
MRAEASEVDRAHAIYTPRNLACYDGWVHGFSNRWIWRCETEKIEGLYREHLSRNHLEVGVGTGSLLAKALPLGDSRVVLFDINSHCLERASRRTAEHRPERHQGNVLDRIDLPGERFDSIGINYVLHCLPGRLEEKADVVFGNLAPLLNRDGVVFGSTILGKDIQLPPAAWLAMCLYNRMGIFSNSRDSLGGIMENLSKRFRTFNVEVCGCVVLFWGKGLRRDLRMGEAAGQ